MIIDGLTNAFINIVLFTILVLFVKGIQTIRKKNYTPMYWISIEKNNIKLLLWGIIIALFRGYLMQVVLKKIPKLLAIILQALVFGLIHYSNYSVLPHKWISIIDAMLIGTILGVIVIKTKSLMFAIGIHLFYDVAEQILFLDNPYKFIRFISFHKYNHLVSNLLGGLFYTEFMELIMLSIITLSLISLFRKDILYKKADENFLNAYRA